MTKHLFVALLLLSGFAPVSLGQPTSRPVIPDRDQLLPLMKRVMEFQIREYNGKDDPDWRSGTFWTGVMTAYHATGDETFSEAALKWGEANEWKLDEMASHSPFHGDAITAGQAYLELYKKYKRPEMLAHLKSHMEQFHGKKILKKGEAGRGYGVPPDAPFIGRHVWWLCDTLYMGPPVVAGLYELTGEQRWLDLLHTLYWDAVEHLYDPGERLFFRDVRYFPNRVKTPKGNKVFWARGNGWVYLGLVRILDRIPQDDPQRQKYIDLFREMTTRIVPLQGEDGMWRSSLNEPDWYPMPESSGTAFFCYGLLAGVNRGYLDRETYLPIALRAWHGLRSHVNEDGRLGYTQTVAAAPGRVKPDDSASYAQGGLLMAASELWRLAEKD